jgi:ion channel
MVHCIGQPDRRRIDVGRYGPHRGRRSDGLATALSYGQTPRRGSLADRWINAKRRRCPCRIRARHGNVPSDRRRDPFISIIGQIFAGLIGLVIILEPNAVTNLEPLNNNFVGNLIYFCFVTLTTTGYGDIVPLHPYARSLANIEAVIGQLYPATLLARLVTLELKSRS